MNDDLEATLKNFVDMVIEYPEQTIEESFRRSGLSAYFNAAQQSVQADLLPCGHSRDNLGGDFVGNSFCSACRDGQ